MCILDCQTVPGQVNRVTEDMTAIVSSHVFTSPSKSIPTGYGALQSFGSTPEKQQVKTFGIKNSGLYIATMPYIQNFVDTWRSPLQPNEKKRSESALKIA